MPQDIATIMKNVIGGEKIVNCEIWENSDVRIRVLFISDTWLNLLCGIPDWSSYIWHVVELSQLFFYFWKRPHSIIFCVLFLLIKTFIGH